MFYSQQVRLIKIKFIKNSPIAQDQRGVSLIELILVVMAVAFLTLLLANLPSSVSSINKSRHTSLAKNIAGKKIESFRGQTFSTLLNETNSFTDPSLNKLPDGTAFYEVSPCPEDVCSIELTEKIKQLKVTVEWNESGDSKKVELITLIGEGGLGQ